MTFTEETVTVEQDTVKLLYGADGSLVGYHYLQETTEQAIVSLIYRLADLVGLHFLDFLEHERLLEHDARLRRLLGEFNGGRLLHDLETVKADYSSDQLSAFGEEGDPHFTKTGILVHCGRDPVKGLHGVRREYCGTKISGYYHCHVRTNMRWADVMAAAEKAAHEEALWKHLLLKRRASAGPPAAEASPDARDERAGKYKPYYDELRTRLKEDLGKRRRIDTAILLLKSELARPLLENEDVDVADEEALTGLAKSFLASFDKYERERK